MECRHTCSDKQNCKHSCCKRHRQDIIPRRRTGHSEFKRQSTSTNLRGSCGTEPLFVAAAHALTISTTVGPSSIRGVGFGLFAARTLRPGESLGWYRGPLLTVQEADTTSSTDLLLLQYRPWWVSVEEYVGGLRVVDGAGTDGLRDRLAYINSSQRTRRIPNVRMFFNGEFRIDRMVRRGAELLMDYEFDP